MVRELESHSRLGDRQAAPGADREQRCQQSWCVDGGDPPDHVERDAVYPFEVALAKAAGGLRKASTAQAQQIRTISRERILGKRIGALPPADMVKVDAALRLHLSL